MSEIEGYTSPKSLKDDSGETEGDNIQVAGKTGDKTGKGKGKAVASKASASKRSASKSGSVDVGLTPVESLLFFNIVRFNNDLAGNVDWDSVAVHSNLKNEASARVRFRQIAKKYNIEINSAGGGGRKRPAAGVKAVNFDDDDDDEKDDAPSKYHGAVAPLKRAATTAARGRSKKIAKKAAGGDEEDAQLEKEADHDREDDTRDGNVAAANVASAAATPGAKGPGQAGKSPGGGPIVKAEELDNPFLPARYNGTAPARQQQGPVSPAYLGGNPQPQVATMSQSIGRSDKGRVTPDEMAEFRAFQAQYQAYSLHIQRQLRQQDGQQPPFNPYGSNYYTGFQMGQGQGGGGYYGNQGAQKPYAPARSLPQGPARQARHDALGFVGAPSGTAQAAEPSASTPSHEDADERFGNQTAQGQAGKVKKEQ